MRSIKSVLEITAMLKLKNKNSNELQLLRQALLEVNSPKFLPSDKVVFESLVADLFPGFTNEKQ